MPKIISRRNPGRPKGSKNRSFEQRVKESVHKKSSIKSSGRPRGSKNQHGYNRSFRKPAKVSYAKLYMNATGGAQGSGTILELLTLLENVVTKTWTDARVEEYFDDGRNTQQTEEVENACHIYISSKGRLVAGDNDVLSKCVLFPGIGLSTKFLDHYIHSAADTMTYGDFVTQTCLRLKRRASALLTLK